MKEQDLDMDKFQKQVIAFFEFISGPLKCSFIISYLQNILKAFLTP